LEPASSGGRANLAALLGRQIEQLARDPAAAEKIGKLQEEIEQLRGEELALLERDANMLPDNAGLQYRLGLALYLAGRNEEAEVRLRKAAETEKTDPGFWLALILLQEKLGKVDEAKSNAKRLYNLAPTPMNEQLLQRLEAMDTNSKSPQSTNQ
jgi:tetratricopeptide (TPR) repeat protein